MNKISGFPSRMGAAISRHLAAGDYVNRAAVLEAIHAAQSEAERVPIDGTAGALHTAAELCARDVYRVAESGDIGKIERRIMALCDSKKIPIPVGADDVEFIKRALDKSWWLRALRKEHARRLEHASIQCGLTFRKRDAYVNLETVIRQRRRNAANARLLENTQLQNDKGDVYTLSELAALGPADKAIRRGELMTRIRGFEEIAQELRHVGLFFTITCPSKFHAQGGKNPRYDGSTPREAQSHLCKVWSRARAVLARRGVKPYGFRIAEPHSDGCPHWHMLFFVPADAVADMTRIIDHHALAVDGDEPGAQENRVKLIRIEAGKGTAAGYIAKYVAKNIDGAGVGDHKVFEDGRTYRVESDLLGNEEILPSERVMYWSQVWGIRQFQQIGGAPVGVWRELRRIKQETVEHAPEAVQRAWNACQKITVKRIGAEASETLKQADYAEFLRAQGGPSCGRRHRVRLARQETIVEGRYAVYAALKPVGVWYDQHGPGAVYESVRYVWTRLDGVAFDLPPWTGVNNCTVRASKAVAVLGQKLDAGHVRVLCALPARLDVAEKLQKNLDFAEVQREARRIEAQTAEMSDFEYSQTVKSACGLEITYKIRKKRTKKENAGL